MDRLYEAKKRAHERRTRDSNKRNRRVARSRTLVTIKPRTFYEVEKLKGVAYLDYKYLGLRLEGAPDGTLEEDYKVVINDELREYPPRIWYNPHWFNLGLKGVSDQDYYTWCFLEAADYRGLSISEESKEWIKIVGTPELQAKRERILERFRRPEQEPIYSPATTKELIRLQKVPNHTKIHQVPFFVRPILRVVNDNLFSDYRPIPSVVDGGEQFPVGYITWYLQDRATEWLASGGLLDHCRALDGIDSGRLQFFNASGREVLHGFYWDLWRDLVNVRWWYVEVLRAARAIQKWHTFVRTGYRLVVHTKPARLTAGDGQHFILV